MKSPYAALLAVRRAEEKEAEVALTGANRAANHLEDALSRARAARQSWVLALLEPAGAPAQASLPIIGRIESVERQTDHDLAGALRVVEAARLALLERRRHREAVERLHLAHLAEVARQAERRAQAELDEIATLRHAGNSF